MWARLWRWLCSECPFGHPTHRYRAMNARGRLVFLCPRCHGESYVLTEVVPDDVESDDAENFA